jgi:hypothetical protein
VAAFCGIALLSGAAAMAAPVPSSGARFALSFDSTLSATPLDGRVYVVISTTNDPEPRDQVLEVEVRSQQVFGADIDALAPGQPAVIDDHALGYPLADFHDLPAGDYWVQGVLNRYTTFHRADGHTVKLPWTKARVSTGTPSPATSTASPKGSTSIPPPPARGRSRSV